MTNDITIPVELRRNIEHNDLAIPQEYRDAGYHRCYEWGFSIIGPPDPEWQNCQCIVKGEYLTKREMTNRISPEDAENDLSYKIDDVKCNVKEYIEYALQIHCGPFRSHNEWLDGFVDEAVLQEEVIQMDLERIKEALALLARIDREDE